MVESDCFGVMCFFCLFGFFFSSNKANPATEADETGENEHGKSFHVAYQTLAGLFQRVETHYKII